MKKVLISMAIMLACFELIAQTTTTWRTIKVKSKVEKTKEITLDQKQIQIGSFFLYLPKLKNQVLRAALSYKPDKKTYEQLDIVNFQNFTIDYMVQSEEKGEKRKIYSSSISLDKEDIVDDRKMYSSRELYSFSNYDWEWDNVPFGTSTKKIRIIITNLEMNGKVLETIPKFFDGLKLEFKFKDSKSRYEDITKELLNRGIYCNKEAFEILFDANPKVFYKKKKNLSSKDLSSLTFPQLEGVEEANQSFKKYNIVEDELQILQSEIAHIIKSVKLKKIFSKDSKKIKKQLQEILNFLSSVLKSGISINDNSGKLLLAEMRMITNVINENQNPKTKISGEELENFNSLIDDVTFIIFLLNNPSNTNGSINGAKEINNVARLVNYNPPAEEYLGDDVSIYVVANTFKDLRTMTPANDYVVKCVPWGYRNHDMSDPEMKEVIRKFPSPSTPTSYPDLLPVANYCFWVEDKEGNKIPLDAKGNWQSEVKIRSDHSKGARWLLNLIRSKDPFEVPIELWLK